jgi:hypothetical protein
MNLLSLSFDWVFMSVGDRMSTCLGVFFGSCMYVHTYLMYVEL